MGPPHEVGVLECPLLLPRRYPTLFPVPVTCITPCKCCSVQTRLSRCESKEAPCCLSTVGFIPALTRTGQAPFSASGGPTPADEASFSHAYSPFVVAAYCCPSGFGMPGVSRPLPPVAAFLCLPGRA